MSLSIAAGNTHVPRAYLNKWARWLTQLQEGTQARALWLLKVQGTRLQVILESGEASLEAGKELTVAVSQLAERAIMDRCAVEDCLVEVGCRAVSVPLCWPDASVYGALVLIAENDEHGLLNWARQLIEADFRALHFVRAIDQHKNMLESRIAERTDDLRALNERLEQELQLSQRTAQVLKQLVISVPDSGHHGFFRQLLQQLLHMLHAEQVFVALLDKENPGQAKTLAWYSEGGWRESFNYTLSQTPCAQALEGRGTFVTSDLAQDFPQTFTQFGLVAQAYMGVPLVDETGRCIGIMAALGDRHMLETHLGHEVLEILAARTGAEIRRMHTEDDLRHLALHDSLTGFPNRSNFKERLELAIAQAERDQTHLAVFFIDLDNFKTINDSLGHDVGDTVLVQSSARLQASMREMDTVARLGGTSSRHCCQVQTPLRRILCSGALSSPCPSL